MGFWCRGLGFGFRVERGDARPSTRNPQPATRNPQPSTVPAGPPSKTYNSSCNRAGHPARPTAGVPVIDASIGPSRSCCSRWLARRTVACLVRRVLAPLLEATSTLLLNWHARVFVSRESLREIAFRQMGFQQIKLVIDQCLAHVLSRRPAPG